MSEKNGVSGISSNPAADRKEKKFTLGLAIGTQLTQVEPILETYICVARQEEEPRVNVQAPLNWTLRSYPDLIDYFEHLQELLLSS